jgi:hypothetical protein
VAAPRTDEDQRLDDLADLDADRGGGLLGRPRALGEGSDLDGDARVGERALDAVGRPAQVAAVCVGGASGVSPNRRPATSPSASG